MTTSIYAVGDVHGQIEMLDHVIDLIDRDGGSDAEIVFLGDYVDRGPDSKAVVDRLIAGVSAAKPWHCVRGNHDRMFCRFVEDGRVDDPRILSGVGWLHPRLGGVETLASYGVAIDDGMAPGDLRRAARQVVPTAHLDFLRTRPLTVQKDGHLFVHAGIRPGIPIDQQVEDDLIWIRDPFLAETAPHPYMIVHGHTALEHPEHYGNRINLDGGAGYGRPLHAAVFEGATVWLLSDRGRVPLRPMV